MHEPAENTLAHKPAGSQEPKYGGFLIAVIESVFRETHKRCAQIELGTTAYRCICSPEVQSRTYVVDQWTDLERKKPETAAILCTSRNVAVADPREKDEVLHGTRRTRVKKEVALRLVSPK